MFTPKNIQGALEELYDLCDPDYMVDMLVNYSEEFDDISPALLAKSFQKNAEMISEYRVLSSAGEGIDYQGKVLLNSRAVRLLSYVEDMSGDEKVRTIQSKELWLAEDMTFYVVSCMSTITMDKEEAICLNEHRSVVTTVECEDDIFFDMGSLICELDDICLFELLADVDATIYELLLVHGWSLLLFPKKRRYRNLKEYDVKITETLEKTVTVQAESHDAAEEQVRAAYYNSEYILDSENFTGVAFGTTEEREVQKEQADTMNVLLVKPFMYPQAVQIGCELEDLQKAVGGDIEATYPFNEPVALVMHDEGKLVGKELNRALRDDDGDIYDIIAGDFLVVGLGEDDFCSLSPELMKQFEEHFHQPETFVRMGRSIMALPLPDDMVKKEDAPVKADSVPHKSNPDRDVL